MFDIFEKLNALKPKQPVELTPVEYIVIGLGNPGKNYENTRHNVGFMVMDYIAKKYNTELKKLKFKSLMADVSINGVRTLLLKPQTYMNNSGLAVNEAMSFYKIKPQNTIIIFDDTSLDIGKIRVKRKGSNGGHNGIGNIIYLSGNNNFPRVKVGIGKKPNPNWDLKDYVLSAFNSEEKKCLQESIENAYKAVCLMLKNNIDAAMNLYN